MMRVRRWRLLGPAALLLGAAAYPRVAGIWPALRGYTRNLPAAGARFRSWPLPARGARILIVGPHGDDETLGCAGLIRIALQRGAQVRVALLTNGDGFHLAAARVFNKPATEGSLPLVSPAEYLQLARLRQRETLRALALLGLPESQVDFLGYPDRGLLPMWETFWEPERPYTSPYTRTDHSPYERAFRRHAPYCGRALLEDLCTLLRRFQPQWVFAPHPDDSHPDHKYGYAFVVTALAQVGVKAYGETGRRGDEGQGPSSRPVAPSHPLLPVGSAPGRNDPVSSRPVIGAYLVHSPDWPSPPGLFLPLPLAPPAALRGPAHHWEVLPLSGPVRERKRQAVLAYTSQTAVLGSLLKSFARANELFERDPPSPFPARPPGAARAKVMQ